LASPTVKTEVEYHLELVRADAEIILGRLRDSTVKPEDLKEFAVALRQAARKVDTMSEEMQALSQN